jgi:hypothetical protein
MPHNARPTRQTEDFPALTSFRWELDLCKTRKFTREQGHTTTRPDMIGRWMTGILKAKMPGDTATAPLFPLDVILPGLELFCLSGQVCRFLRRDENSRRLEFRWQQIAFVNDIAESRYNIPVSINVPTERSIVHDPVSERPSPTGRTSRDNGESMSPSITIVRNKSSIGFNRKQRKTH